MHKAVTRHDQAPRRHYASHEQRWSFEHVEDCVARHFYIWSQHPFDQTKFGVFLTSQSVGYDCDNLKVSQMIATSKDVSTAISSQDHILDTVSRLLTRKMNRSTYQKIASAILYCVPLILRSGKSPSIFALPEYRQQCSRQTTPTTTQEIIPILALSIKLIRYKTKSIGTSLQSTFLSTTFFCSSENEARKPASSGVRLPLWICSSCTTVVLSSSTSWSEWRLVSLGSGFGDMVQCDRLATPESVQ